MGAVPTAARRSSETALFCRSVSRHPAAPELGEFARGYLLEGYRKMLPVDSRLESHLHGVLHETLTHPGSLIRAELAFGILRQEGCSPNIARRVAIAIEYFHTASLLLDDLPCMDDAQERRGHACAHVLYGEAPAILGALALINQAYLLTWRAIAELPAARRDAAASLVTACLGARGILDGQSRDLHFDAASSRGDDVLAVAEGKTAMLIRLTLLLPARIAGVENRICRDLDRLASVWGAAYQITDDFKDILGGSPEGGSTGKTPDRDRTLGRPNLPRQIGLVPALAQLDALLAESESLLAGLDGRWQQLATIQDRLVRERQALAVSWQALA